MYKSPTFVLICRFIVVFDYNRLNSVSAPEKSGAEVKSRLFAPKEKGEDLVE